MAAQDTFGKFVPSEQQLRNVDVLRSEFALLAAQRTYWEYRGALAVADVISVAFAELCEAIKEGSGARAISVLRSRGIRGPELAAPLSFNIVRLPEMFARSDVAAAAVYRAPVEGVLPGLFDDRGKVEVGSD